MQTIKTDNEPLFVDSTLVCKHDSKPFEYNNSAFHGAGRQETMKENQDEILCDLKVHERDTDALALEMEDSYGYWNTSELEYAMVVDDFSKAEENEAKDSIPPCLVSSSKAELFEEETEETEDYTDKNVMECELPELIVCYKESAYHVVKDICIDEGVPSEDKILTESANDGQNGNFHFRHDSEDKNYDIHEGVASEDKIFIDTGDDDQKGLCTFKPCNGGTIDDNYDVHEGVASADKIFIDSGDDDQKGLGTFKPCNGDTIDDITKERVDIELLIPDLLTTSSGKVSENDAANECGTQEKVGIDMLSPDELKCSSENDSDKDDAMECGSVDSIQTSEGNVHTTEDSMDDDLREKFVPISNLSVQHSSGQDSCQSLLESSEHSRNLSSQAECTELISETPELVSTVEVSTKCGPANDLSYNSKVEIGTITFDFNSIAPAATSQDESPENLDHEQPIETQNAPNKPEDSIYDTHSLASQVQNFPGESSFSASGPPSGLITYSGPIAYSGSLSLRSDSSTTSTRSFAFPILQSDWNSSPVRMAKADRRHFRKHRGWRHGILCCRF